LAASGVGKIEPLPVDVSEGACVLFSAEEQRQDDLYRFAQAKGDNVQCGMTSRVMLQARKLALLWACSAWDCKAGTRPVVTVEAAQWALAVVAWLMKRTLAMFARNAKTTLDFERRVGKMLAYITKSGGTVAHSPLTNFMKLPKREFVALIETLVDRGTIEIGVTKTNTKTGRAYSLAKPS
jgi:hypothetical protein